ncbi:MAG TPA: ABC transporter substrate-binding protein [Pirellulaceae bacterium]|nr:ABC transporter substrate-binding protein [Pirellulaceae bacterium]
MKKIILIALVVITAVTIVVMAKNQETESDAKHKASVQFSWIPSASFAGDVVGIKKYAKRHGLELTSEFGGPGVNPIQLVVSGQKTFGWAGADEVLVANEKGADLVIVGLIHPNPPAGFASLAGKGIKTPNDLIGKKVGMLPFGNLSMIYESMLKKNNVNRSGITEITVSSDLKPFLNDTYDVHPIFVYDESVELDREHGEYNIIKPEDFGVKDIKGYVYFTNRQTLEQNPEMVQAFVRTMTDGWNDAINNQAEAIMMLKEIAPEIDVEREREVLKRAIPYFTAYQNQPLNSDYESWSGMVTELIDAGLITNSPNLEKILQFQFINEYYL